MAEAPDDDAEDASPGPGQRLRKLLGRALGLAIVLGAILGVLYVSRQNYRQPRTDDAFVRANIVGIAPHVSGPIVELNVVDNQAVAAGDLLFVVDPRPYEAALAQAKAALLLARAEVAATERAVAAARAEVARLEDEAQYAARHASRLQAMAERQFASRDASEDAVTRSRGATLSLERARSELARQQQLVAQFGNVNARLAAADAAVVEAQLNVDYCFVRAPFEARVTNLNTAVGEYARAGQQVFALIDARQWYVLANFRETYLDSIRPGMRADVSLLAYPEQRFGGTVQGIGWAIRADGAREIGLLPEPAETLDWVRLSQRIPVRIVLDAADPQRPYRMGMTAVVTIRGEPPPQER